jgi:hypothetical protein
MVFRLFPEPIVPCEAVPHDEAAQDIVRPEDPDNAQREECEGDAECEEGFVVDQPDAD